MCKFSFLLDPAVFSMAKEPDLWKAFYQSLSKGFISEYPSLSIFRTNYKMYKTVQGSAYLMAACTHLLQQLFGVLWYFLRTTPMSGSCIVLCKTIVLATMWGSFLQWWMSGLVWLMIHWYVLLMPRNWLLIGQYIGRRTVEHCWLKQMFSIYYIPQFFTVQAPNLNRYWYNVMIWSSADITTEWFVFIVLPMFIIFTG